MGIVSMILARAIRFGIDGLQGPANEEAREILERRLYEAEVRRAEDRELLSGTIMAVSRALSQRHDESVWDAAERVVADRDAARIERDHERKAQAEAFAEWESERAELVARVDKVTADRDARRTERAYEDAIARALVTLGAQSETIEDAARRVLAERDAARASAALVTMVGDIGVRNSGDATKLEGIIAERDTLRAELEAIRAAVGEESAEETLGSLYMGAGARAVYRLGRTCAMAEVAMMREAARGRDEQIEALRVGQETQAEELAAAIARAEKAEADVTTLRARIARAETRSSVSLDGMTTAYLDAVGDHAKAAEAAKAIDRGDAGGAARMAGTLPVASDEELNTIGEEAFESDPTPFAMASRALAYAAVARRVRAERPACLVARAVELGCDVRVAEDVAGWLVGAHESADLDEVIERDVPSTDVPAVLSRMLDEVAQMKGGGK